MDLQNFLTEVLKERFKASATINAIQKQVEEMAERSTFEKYKDKPLFKNEMEFELIGVRATFWSYSEDLKIRNIDIWLAYFCKSKLPKAKRERLQKVKDSYKEDHHLEWSNYKIPIWEEHRYSVELENVLSGNINLHIK